MTRAFFGLLRRELQIVCRRPAAWLLPPTFFFLVVAVFSIAAADSPAALRALAAGVLWCAALLAALLSQDGVFQFDNDNGFLQQMLVSPRPLPLLALAKAAAHWLLTAAPLALVAPLAGVMLGAPMAALPTLTLTLLLGGAILSLLVAFAAALALGQKNALLAVLLALPLCIPALVFSVAAVGLAGAGLPAAAPLLFLAALAALALTFLPLATAGVLRATGAMR